MKKNTYLSMNLTDMQCCALWKVLGDLTPRDAYNAGLSRDEQQSLDDLYDKIDARPEFREGSGQ